jgi:putative transposase
MAAVKRSIRQLGIRRACSAVGLSRALFYRLERSAKAVLSCTAPAASGSQPDAAGGNSEIAEADVIACAPPAHRPCSVPGRALTGQEEQAVIDVLHSDEYMDKTPTEVCTALLDAGNYLCSRSTMYRILHKHSEVKERRAQRRHPVYARPELIATGPNQVWSWDITRLKGSIKYSYHHLYVIIDIYSRYVVGWMVADRESEDLAKDLIARTILHQKVPSGQLTIHADRGASMTSKTVTDLLVDLGVVKSHSRPRTSNDNPFSESQFRTIKYRPEFPERFSSLQEARLVCRELLTWYNTRHYHSGIGLLTPESVHYGRAQAIIEQRAKHLRAAYAAHPQRFVNKPPTPHALPAAVYINPPAPVQSREAAPLE